jgi:hypothetical protein
MVLRILSLGHPASVGLLVMTMAVQVSVARAGLAGEHHKKAQDGTRAAKPIANASEPPAFSIPVEPLGFYSPGAFYQGQRESLVSLDFLDENRLLFTFRAPGLIHRTRYEGDERHIRAVVLSLPQGSVDAEALWTVHDHDQYLWMLKSGHFLLRDGDTLKEGNVALELTPMLQFPGPIVWLQMDPTQQFLVTDSAEPPATKPKSGQVGSPVTAQASISTGDDDSSGQPEMVLRILQLESGKVMLVSRIRMPVHLPISPEGYLETLRGSGRNWVLNLNYFTGGSKILGKLESSCQPPVAFASRDEALANVCSPQGGRALVAVSTEGRRLWVAPSAANQVWPLLVMAPDGSCLARETLLVSHPVDPYAPLDFEDVVGQLVEVYDAAEGRRELVAPASPVLDGGGNVAISPSGRRVAVLNAGAIQVYELPLPGQAGSDQAKRTP